MIIKMRTLVWGDPELQDTLIFLYTNARSNIWGIPGCYRGWRSGVQFVRVSRSSFVPHSFTINLSAHREASSSSIITSYNNLASSLKSNITTGFQQSLLLIQWNCLSSIFSTKSRRKEFMRVLVRRRQCVASGESSVDAAIIDDLGRQLVSRLVNHLR